MTADEIKEYGREWMLERASIIEFEAGVPRYEAERQAVEQWHKLRRTDVDLQVSEVA